MIKIAPSLLASDFSALGEQVRVAERAGADMLHIDVMDGAFVPPISIGADVVASLRKYSDIIFDVHLMVMNPEKHVEDFARAGADIITVSYEATPHVHRAVQMVKGAGKKACVAINPATPLSAFDHILDDVDMLLIMSVNPGFGGQKYIPASTAKISELRGRLVRAGKPELDIQVDGGITVQTAALAAGAGANVLVAGTAVYRADDPKQAVEQIRAAAQKAAN